MAARLLRPQHRFMNASSRPAPTLDAESLAWIARLCPQSSERAAAVEDLRALLLKASQFEVGRRRAALASLCGDERQELAQRCADDALLALLGKLDDFRGGSRFTTWAEKFALLEAAVTVRRLAWEGHVLPAVPEDLSWLGTTDSTGSEGVEMKRALQEAIEHQLTPHQREVLLSLTLNNVPVDVLAERLNTTRGALYETVHDARQALRVALAARGIDPNPPQAEATHGAADLEQPRTPSPGAGLALRLRSRWRAKTSALP